MSICPEKHIHSLYLDNELSPEDRLVYEAHLKECSKCYDELEKLRRVKNLFHTNTKNIDFNENDIVRSYNKLSQKMNFSRNRKKSRIIIDIGNFKEYAKYAVMGASAALVLVIALPIKANRRPPMPPDFEPFIRPPMDYQYRFSEQNHEGFRNPHFREDTIQNMENSQLETAETENTAPALGQYDVFEVSDPEKKGTVHLRLSSPIMNISLDIDK